ncbi:MAG: hypothetical protein KI791_00030 [Cyclobacteriaceae bacterium]|nr:hypothetical protein [Cyclobacteriaceae bacterium SS2]
MKISLIGMGRVGSALAYTILLRGLADELVLVDKNPNISTGEALDLQHAEAFTDHQMNIYGGEINDTIKSDILVICSSVQWNPSYTSRFDIGHDNLKLFKTIIPPLTNISPDAKLLIITNPVDVMTYHAIKLSGFESHRVFGSGTLIDSARFRTLLSQKTGIHPDDLRAYILGEHGDSQFPLFSMAMAGGSKISEDKISREIYEKTRKAGHEVMDKKGHTNYAISMSAALIIEAIVWDSHRTIPVSLLVNGYLDEYDVCLSLPAVIGKNGISKVIEPVLKKGEVMAFHQCAETVREGIRQSQED